MLQIKRVLNVRGLAGAVVFVTVVAAASPAQEQGYSLKTLWSFTGATGANPYAGLVRDAAGNLYGTTENGGAGHGTVFKEPAAGGPPIILWSFTNGADGANPLGGLVRDAAGNLYGTTYEGGDFGYGTVFEEPAAGGHPITLWSFTRGTDGADPAAGLVRDAAGNLYGTTEFGGAGFGTIFEEPAAGGQPIILWSFGNGADGANPTGALMLDAAGNLYGMTPLGGLHARGALFEELAAGGQPITLWSFTGEADGEFPQAGLVRDAAGNLYGTTNEGGAFGFGTVFEEPGAGGQPITLWSFTGGADGRYPAATLVRDRAGNLYGTTREGGGSRCILGCGTVFEEPAAGGHPRTLWSFTGGADGTNPVAGLVRDRVGNLYGTTEGTLSNGTVFELQRRR